MKKPFFISPPRTRSTILYESLVPFVTEKTRLLPCEGHSEPFLHTLQNKTIIDSNTGLTHQMEMYPIATDKSLSIHYIYPWVFKDNRTSVIEKLKLLKKARDNGNEYYIKGTYNIADAIDETMDFFSDYDIVLTLRRDIKELVCSVLYATQIKMFHSRTSNRDLYERTKKNITVSDETISQIKHFMRKISILYNLKDVYDLNVVYYEDLDTCDNIDECISNIIGTEEWKGYRPEGMPTPLDNCYNSLINNYDQVIEEIQQYETYFQSLR